MSRFCPAWRSAGRRRLSPDAAYIWDVDGGRQLAKLDHGQVYGLSFSPDGHTLATAGWDKNVRFWEADTGAEFREFDVDGGQAGQPNVDVRMYTVCYSPAGDLLATAQLDGTVKIWKLPELSLHGSLKLKGRFIYGAISFSPDGLWLATGSLSGEVTLWDVYACEKVFDVGRHEHYVYTLGFGRDAHACHGR